MSVPAHPILVIGSLNMDLVAHCDHLPAKGETLISRNFFTAPGGKGANQAVAAAKLGAPVSMAGCVGQDGFGQELIASLREAGVVTEWIVSVDGSTGTALITIDAAGANTIVVVSGANNSCDAALVDRALAQGGAPGTLLLQHEISPAANARALRVGHEAGWFVILNPAPFRPIAPELLGLVDLLAPNQTEAAALTGCSVADRQQARKAVQALLAMGARAVLMTLGEDGALYGDAAHLLHCPAVSVNAVDTTAAGDSYLGAFAAARAEQQNLPHCLGFAAAAAALAVTRAGAQPSLPTRTELAAFIGDHGIPVPQPLTG